MMPWRQLDLTRGRESRKLANSTLEPWEWEENRYKHRIRSVDHISAETGEASKQCLSSTRLLFCHASDPRHHLKSDWQCSESMPACQVCAIERAPRHKSKAQQSSRSCWRCKNWVLGGGMKGGSENLCSGDVFWGKKGKRIKGGGRKIVSHKGTHDRSTRINQENMGQILKGCDLENGKNGRERKGGEGGRKRI